MDLFLLFLEKFGSFFEKLLLSSISKSDSISASSWSRVFLVNSDTGSFSPSIISSPSISNASISGISGLLWRVLATGIFAAPAIANRAELLVISTICLLSFLEVRANIRKFTALRRIPTPFGGTRAIILSLASLILLTTSVISSSTSI